MTIQDIGTAVVFHSAESDEVHAIRDRPTEAFIDEMRRDYPTENEYDQMLTRKLRRRREARQHQQISLGSMTQHLVAFLRDHVNGDFAISDERWMLGGASKIQFGFTLVQQDDNGERRVSRLVARMEPRESLNATSRRRERQLLDAMVGVVPVPRTHWVDAEGRWFPEPVLIYDLAPGVSRPSDALVRVSGTGQNFGTALRGPLGEQFIEHLGRIHTYDVDRAPDLSAFDKPRIETNDSAIWQLNRARRVWEEDRGEDLPFLEVAARWLETNLPTLDRLSVVHGDYRAGNFLFDEESARITAWLDWERGYLGDRHRDLAWTATRSFGHLAEDGTTFLVSGLIPVADFYRRYEDASGLTVDPERLLYYRVFNAYQLVVSNLASTYRVAKNAGSHQDLSLAWSHGVSYPIAHELVAALEEVL